MKKVLVTGAGGAVGIHVIKYLLMEGKYEITAIDLKNKNNFRKLKKYRKRINIIYGDLLDRSLTEALVKDHDVIIHLASCMPPLANYKKELSELIDLNTTEIIVRAINYYNPKCQIIYASTTTLYGPKTGAVDNKIEIDEDDYYSVNKYKAEKMIIKKAKNYVILRLPLILSDLRNDIFLYNLNKKDIVETITKEDAAYAFCRAIEIGKVNKNILNIGGGPTCRISYEELLKNIIKYHGISFKYITSRLFVTKNYHSPVLLDSDESQKVLNYQSDSLESYYMRQKRRSKKRKFQLIISKPYVKWLERKGL